MASRIIRPAVAVVIGSGSASARSDGLQHTNIPAQVNLEENEQKQSGLNRGGPTESNSPCSSRACSRPSSPFEMVDGASVTRDGFPYAGCGDDVESDSFETEAAAALPLDQPAPAAENWAKSLGQTLTGAEIERALAAMGLTPVRAPAVSDSAPEPQLEPQGEDQLQLTPLGERAMQVAGELLPVDASAVTAGGARYTLSKDLLEYGRVLAENPNIMTGILETGLPFGRNQGTPTQALEFRSVVNKEEEAEREWDLWFDMFDPCSICDNTLCEPHVLNCTGHTFCGPCLADYKLAELDRIQVGGGGGGGEEEEPVRCPICRQPVDLERSQLVFTLAQNIRRRVDQARDCPAKRDWLARFQRWQELKKMEEEQEEDEVEEPVGDQPHRPEEVPDADADIDAHFEVEVEDENEAGGGAADKGPKSGVFVIGGVVLAAAIVFVGLYLRASDMGMSCGMIKRMASSGGNLAARAVAAVGSLWAANQSTPHP